MNPTTDPGRERQDMKNVASRIWATRPRRLPKSQGGEAWFAGVCEGMAVRYQVDAVLLRVIFAVAMLAGGGGLAAYLLAWGLMPRYGMNTSPIEAAFKSKDTRSPEEQDDVLTGWVTLLLAALLIFTTMGAAIFAGPLLLALGVLGLHYRTPNPPQGLIPEEKMTSDPVNLSSFHPVGNTTPPTWDPLGTAPFAWDLPEPPPREVPKTSNPAKTILKIIGGFAIVIFIGAATIFGFGVVLHPNNNQTFGSSSYTFTDENFLQTDYSTTLGSVNLDFTDLETLSTDRHIKAGSGLGTINVTLPSEVRTEVICHSDFGSVDCPTSAVNPDAEGATLYIDAYTGLGSVEVSASAEN